MSDYAETWYEYTKGGNLVNFKKKYMVSSLIRRYDVIIVILMLRQIQKWKVFIASLFLDECR